MSDSDAVAAPLTPSHGNGAIDASSMSSAALAVGETKTFSDELWDQIEVVYQRLTKGRHDLKRIKAYRQS